jgi:capsular exopolysaccharide synthesis family protein
MTEGTSLDAAAKIRLALAKGRPQARAGHDEAELDIVYGRTAVLQPPPGALQRQGILAGEASHPLADAFRILRTQVLAGLDGRGGRILAVCAAQAGEGKSFVAANLAVAVASLFARTALLVDLDLRRPSVHRQFGLEPARGLADCLMGRAALEDCLVNPGIPRLVLLPQPAPLASGSSELLASPRMASLARELGTRYPDRVVILNTPPLLATDDALTAIGLAHGCLLVVREGRTGRAAVARAAELIGRERFLGSVLNDARWAKSPGYGL